MERVGIDYTAEWTMFVFHVMTECSLLLNKFDFKMNSLVCLFFNLILITIKSQAKSDSFKQNIFSVRCSNLT